MKIHHTMSFDYVERKGKTYMKVSDFTVTMDPEKVVFKFDNLFNGEKELGDNINKVSELLSLLNHYIYILRQFHVLVG